MEKNEIKKELQLMAKKLNELEEEYFIGGFKEEKVKEEIDFLKRRISLFEEKIENKVNEFSNEEVEKNEEKNENGKRIIKREPKKDKKNIDQESYILEFFKKNSKIVMFSTMLLIGIVWLFVYVSSLTDYSKELRIYGALAISVIVLIFRHTKIKNDGYKIIATLTGYSIGILSLLFGTMFLEVIPEMAAVGISIIYIIYSVLQIKNLNSEIYNISITCTSFLLIFAYRYVDAPILILYVYTIIMLFALYIIINKIKNIRSVIVLFLTTIVASSSLAMMNFDEIENQRTIFIDKYEQENQEKFFEYKGLSYDLYKTGEYYDLKEKEYLKYDKVFEDFYDLSLKEYSKEINTTSYINLIAFVFVLISVAYLMFKTKSDGNGFKWIISAMYASAIPYLMFLIFAVDGVLNKNYSYVIFTIIVLSFTALCYVVKREKSDSLIKNYSFAMLFSSIFATLNYTINNMDIAKENFLQIIMTLVLILIMTIYTKKENITSLKIISGVLTVISSFNILAIISDIPVEKGDNIFTNGDFWLVVISVVTLALISIINYKKVHDKNNKNILYNIAKFHDKLYSPFVFVIMVNVVKEFSYKIWDTTGQSFISLNLVSLFIIIAFIITAIFRSKLSENGKILTVTVELSYLYILVASVFPRGIFENSEMIIAWESIIYAFLFASLIFVWKKNMLIFGKPVKEKNIAIRSAVNMIALISVFNFMIAYIEHEIIMYSILMGINILYAVFEINVLEKIKDKSNYNKIIKILLYVVAAIHLMILTFGLLSEVPFIIRALIFMTIGIYGLFTSLKNKKTS